MRRLVLTSTARQDLLDIDNYLMRTAGDAQTARRFTNQLLDRSRKPAGLPDTLGTSRDELAAGVRTVAHRGYLIVFRYEPGALRVLRFIEGHRDVDRNFQPGGA